MDKVYKHETRKCVEWRLTVSHNSVVHAAVLSHGVCLHEWPLLWDRAGCGGGEANSQTAVWVITCAKLVTCIMSSSSYGLPIRLLATQTLPKGTEAIRNFLLCSLRVKLLIPKLLLLLVFVLAFGYGVL